MKNTFFTNCLLMNAHLSLLVDMTMEKLAFVLSLGKALEDKDDLDEDDRFSDDTFQQQESYFDLISPFVKAANQNIDSITHAMFASNIIPISLIDGIKTCLGFKEESQHFQDGPFNPFFQDDETTEELYYRLCFIYRVYYWLVDIEIGIQDYGLLAYVVPSDDSKEAFNPFDELLNMKKENLISELKIELLSTESDTNEMKKQKKELEKFIKTLED